MTAIRSQPCGDTLPASVLCVACGTTIPSGSTACPSCGRPSRPSQMREPGTILGSYRVIETLGAGGMGVVYLAEHTRLGRRVAIKMLRSEFTDNPIAVRRFFSEARAVNKISHPNIVEITDFIENPGADNYYVMELLRGDSLAAVLDEHGIQPLARTVGIMAQVATALEAVHAAGIIHRDLKPDNVFLIERAGQKDFVKLLDFGVAKLAGVGDGIISLHQTAAGAILGTPEYMSPEQASGRPVDARTDIYAFGVMLYELVTGRLPLVGTSFGELVVKHLTVDPTPPRKVPGLPHEVPESLEDLILACLAKDAGDRPAQISTAAERLIAIAEVEGWSLTSFGDAPRATGRMAVLSPLHHRVTSPEVVVAPRTLRRPLLLLGLAGAMAVAVAAAVITFGDDPPAAVSEQIEIELETVPAGAEVFRRGEAVALGRTPMTVELARSARSQTFELRLPGHLVATQSVRLDRSTRLSASLVPIPVAPPPTVLPPPIASPPIVVVTPAPERKPRPGPKPRAAKPAPAPGSAAAKPAPPPVDRSAVLNPFEPR